MSDLERELEGKTCEICNRNKATIKSSTGGGVVYYCKPCQQRYGQDYINSRLPRGKHTEEMLNMTELLKATKQ